MTAKKVRVVNPKVDVENQKTFKERLLMECDLASIGKVKLTVGVHKKSSIKIQDCITANKKPTAADSHIFAPGMLGSRLLFGDTGGLDLSHKSIYVSKSKPYNLARW